MSICKYLARSVPGCDLEGLARTTREYEGTLKTETDLGMMISPERNCVGDNLTLQQQVKMQSAKDEMSMG